MATRHTLPIVAAVALAAALAAAAEPVAERVGRWVVRYRGPEIEAVVGYRFASTSIGAQWLLLDIAVTGASGRSVEISRDRVFLRTPEGSTVPLPDQESFGEAYSALRSTVNRADIAADPLDYWSGRAECAIDFLVEPGSGISRLSSWVNDRRICSGRLFFFIPEGIQPGPYTLGIDLEESKVRIPFELREQ